MKLSNWGIGTKLRAGFLVLLILVAVMSIFGIYSLNKMTKSAEDIIQISFKQEQRAKNWQMESNIGMTNVVAFLRATDKESLEYFRQNTIKQSEIVSDIQKSIETHLKDNKENDLFLDISNKRNLYTTTRLEVNKLKDSGEQELAIKMLDDKLLPQLEEYKKSLNNFLNYYDNKIIEAEKNINVNSDNTIYMLIFSGVLSVLLGVIISQYLTKNIINPLNTAVKISEEVSNGILKNNHNIVINSKDEFGKLLTSLIKMQNNLAKTLTEISKSSDLVSNAASEIAAGNIDLSARTEEQASALEETAATMEELSSVIKQNSLNAQQATELATEVSNSAHEGGKIVNNIIEKMSDIKSSSEKIKEIVAVMDSIAFQTNILSLNAAVEAARAGEQGRGFAVVANEVRSLAKKSAESAKEIKQLIEISTKNVLAGHTLVSEAGTKMSNIVEGVKIVSQSISDISTAIKEQSSGIEQVNQAVIQMDSVTQQNAALVEQASAAAQMLDEQSKEMNNLIYKFKIS